MGSACALIELLRLMGKQVRFVVDSPIAEKFQFLDFHQSFKSYSNQLNFDEIQVLIVLDTHRLERIGRLATLLEKPGIAAICIDHHLPTSTFTLNTVIDARACATGAMIYTLYKEIGYPLSLEAATGIYTSIISDTGRFSYASTTRKAHKLADECIKFGVDPQLMHQRLYQQIPLDAISLFISALSSSELFFDKQTLVQSIKRSDYDHLKIDLHDADYLHEFNKSLKGIKCTILLRELANGRVRISLRSASNDISVEPPMKALGGGGHSKAAGATIHAPLEEAKRKVLDLLKEQFP